MASISLSATFLSCLFLPALLRSALLVDARILDAQSNFARSLFNINQDLSRRDICSDALPGQIDSQCTPSNTSVTTLCCVNPSASFPQCDEFLGVGFCVVDSSGGSYTDTESVCDLPNSVRCADSLSGDGSTICCPQYTNCDSSGNFTQGFVRCTAETSILKEIFASSTTSSSSTSSTSPPTTTSHTKTHTTGASDSATGTAADSTSSSQGSSGGGLSGGAIAGIAIAAALVILAVLLFGWWVLFKKRKHKDTNTINASTAYAPYSQGDNVSGYKHEMEGTATQKGYHQPAELAPGYSDQVQRPAYSYENNWNAQQRPGQNPSQVHELH